MPLEFPSFSDSLDSHKAFTQYSREIAWVIGKILWSKKNPFWVFDVSWAIRKSRINGELYEVLWNSVNRVPYRHHKYPITKQTIRKLWMMSQDEESVFLLVLAYLSWVTALSTNPKWELFLELEWKIIPINDFKFNREELLDIILSAGWTIGYQAGIEDISYKRGEKGLMKIRTRTKKFPNGVHQNLVTLKSPLWLLLAQYPKFFSDQNVDPIITHPKLKELWSTLKLLWEEEFGCNDLATFNEMLRIYGFHRAKIKNKLRDSLQWLGGFLEFDQFVNGMPLYLEPEWDQEVVFEMMDRLSLLDPEICRIIDSWTRWVHEILWFEEKLLRVGNNGIWDKDILNRANQEREEIDNKMAEKYFSQQLAA